MSIDLFVGFLTGYLLSTCVTACISFRLLNKKYAELEELHKRAKNLLHEIE